jgi:hypothetical protein
LRGRRSYISAGEAFLHQQQQQYQVLQPLVGGAGNAHPTRGEGRRRGGDMSSRLKGGEKEQRPELQLLEQPNSQQPTPSSAVSTAATLAAAKSAALSSVVAATAAAINAANPLVAAINIAAIN